ncbi:MAG: S-layer homology domain-containing protein [Bacillota bacterium]|nr:S-layer homology domain-containing protein [Bacillota bacterium]
MKNIGRCSVLLTLLLLLALVFIVPPAAAAPPDEAAAHSYYVQAGETAPSPYGQANYLYDTLTITGEGMAGQVVYTVLELEALAADAALNLGWQDVYSLLSRGNVFTEPLFSGVRAYELLQYAGLKADLPDGTAVKFISKDGYATSLTLGQLRQGYNRYAGKEADAALITPNQPVLIAYGVNGLPLVGPTGSQAVYTKFTAADGYDEARDNSGGPLRLVIGQRLAGEYNAPSCAKWLAAIVVGDAGDYVYSRDSDSSYLSDSVPQGGDWTHSGDYAAYAAHTLTISGSEAKSAVLTLSELEAATELIVRDYFAASAGRNIYEGLKLNELIKLYLAEGVEAPGAVTVISGDGYAAALDLHDLANGVVSGYQPGLTRPLLLAYAIDGAPLVETAQDPLYNGGNAYGPLRLVVENTISKWVKDVELILIGEPVFTDLSGEYAAVAPAVYRLYARGAVHGRGDGGFYPQDAARVGEAVKMLLLAQGQEPPQSTAGENWAEAYLRLAAQQGLPVAEQAVAGAYISREELNALLAAIGTELRLPAGGATVSRAELAALLSRL